MRQRTYPVSRQLGHGLDSPRRGRKGSAMSFTVRTDAFRNGGEIPAKYTCSGINASPALQWSDAPQGSRSLALIVDDPDAPGGTWTHWVIWDIPPQAAGLPEGVPHDESLNNGARQGKNDFGRAGYGGPCPPPGKPHRYFFRMYALDKILELKAGSERPDLEDAMKRHILTQAEWMGVFKR
jgi:Raf kinase inhibitor-like YbhB/YbcL family protein